MNKQLIINADDFGLSKGTNQAIIGAFKKGILTSASILATTPAFSQVPQLVKQNPKLGVGVHLSLTWGKAILSKKEIPDLIDSDGYFYPSFGKVFIKSLNKNVKKQIEKEFRAQIEKIKRAEIVPDHLNGQHHIHMLPTIFPIVKQLSKNFCIPHIRIPNEPFSWIRGEEMTLNKNLLKYFTLKMLSVISGKSQVGFYGVLYTNNMNTQTLTHIIKKLPSANSEILLHPGFLPMFRNNFDFIRQGISGYANQRNRLVEYEALVNTDIKKIITQQKIKLIRFCDIV